MLAICADLVFNLKMFIAHSAEQLDFAAQFFIPEDDPIRDTHPYVRLANEIEWFDLLDALGKFYSEGRGRPSIPVKNMILLLMFKHFEQLSDRELVGQIGCNMAMQKALNISFQAAQDYIDASSLSKFRQRIGEDGMVLIEAAVNKIVKKKGKKSRDVFVDTTVVPSNILYPTDIRLLEASRKFLLGFIKENATTFTRTYSRVARRAYLNYIKFRKAKRQFKHKVHGQMLRFVKRNLQQAQTLVERSAYAIDKKFLERIETIKTLITQQEELRKKTPRNGSKSGIHIKDRIVSIYKAHVRPIPRGKIPMATEFGAKILLELRGGILTLLKTTFDNLADSEMLTEFLPRYKGLNLGADRGFDAPKNTKAGLAAEIKNYCIEKKGKHNRKLDSAKVKRMRKQRSAIEAKISLAKRKFGLHKNLYGRGTEGEAQWIRLGLCAMNLKFALREP